MDEVKLHQLIRSLTKDQKSNFTRFVGNGRRTKDLILYKMMSAFPELDDRFRKKLHENGMEDSTKYYIYRVRLAEKIVQSFAAYANNLMKVSLAEFIRQAVLMDCLEIVTGPIRDQMKEWLKEEDFISIRYIYDYCRQLERKYRVKIPFPSNLPSRREVNEWIEEIESFEEMIEQGKLVYKEGGIKQRRVAKIILEKIQDQNSSSQSGKFLRGKVAALAYTLKGEWENAIDCLEEIIIGSHNLPSITVVQKIFVQVQVGLIYSNLGDREEILKRGKAISKMNDLYPWEERTCLYHIITNFIATGEQFAEVDFALKGLEMLNNSKELFDQDRLSKLLIMLVLSFVYSQKWDQALFCIGELQKSKIPSDSMISWEPEFLLFFIHAEKGNFDLLDSLFRSSLRVANHYEASYPKLVVKTYKQIKYASSNGQKDILLTKAIAVFSRLLETPSEMRYARIFNFLPWLESQKTGIHIHEVILRDFDNNQFRPSIP